MVKLRKKTNFKSGIGHNRLPVFVPLRDRIRDVPIEAVRPSPKSPRRHSKRKIGKLAKSVQRHGLVTPLIVDERLELIDGHAVLLAANNIGMKTVPVVILNHLTPGEAAALRLGINKLVEQVEWDTDLLVQTLQPVIDEGLDLDLTGFEIPEIDLIIKSVDQSESTGSEEFIPDRLERTVTTEGDLWCLDHHRVLCGDATVGHSYEILLRGDLAAGVVTDPPYNVPIDGNVCGSGSIKHADFVQGAGEMSPSEFSDFLDDFVRNIVLHSADGSVHYICMDWRHSAALTEVCERHYARQLDTCVWVKPNGGMGGIYRSRHEFVMVWKKGDAPHLNNVQLGKHKRNRTNVWEYEGANSFSPERRRELALHPTVKPAAMVADAILDTTPRGGIVLDPFLGSGTLLIACEKTGRVGYGMELDRGYVDTAIRRWQEYTGQQAIQARSGLTFDQLADKCSDEDPLLLLPPNQKDGGSDAP
ncbi:MAG: DNA methyltransferase [Alphaproteobacteria bacterium]